MYFNIFLANYVHILPGDQCRLEVAIVDGIPKQVLNGTTFLSKLATVFDNTTNRIGFYKCGNNPISY